MGPLCGGDPAPVRREACRQNPFGFCKGGFNLYFQIGVFPGAVLAVKSERAHP